MRTHRFFRMERAPRACRPGSELRVQRRETHVSRTSDANETKPIGSRHLGYWLKRANWNRPTCLRRCKHIKRSLAPGAAKPRYVWAESTAQAVTAWRAITTSRKSGSTPPAYWARTSRHDSKRQRAR